MSATRRPRARYASKAQVKRALELAREAGMRPGGLTLGADGSVTILDSAPQPPADAGPEGSADDAFAAWEAAHGVARR